MIPVGSRLEPAIEALARRHPHLAKPLRQSRLGPSLAQFLEPDSSVPAQVPPSEQEARAAQLREARAPVVLLAEDDPVNREALRLLLDTFGCDVETVTDGEQAVEAVGRTRFDVVLMDWQMPKMDGLQATAAIRELESTARHTRIVAVTASGSPAERELCVQAASKQVAMIR